MGFPDDMVVKNSPAHAGDIRDLGSIPESGRFPGGGDGNHSGILAGKSHGQRSPEDYSLWGCQELDVTEHTCMHLELHSEF